jgi:hypothetical protein
MKRIYSLVCGAVLMCASPTWAGQSLTLSWQDPNDNEDGVYVERRVDGGSWQRIQTLPVNSVSTQDTVELGHVYTYRVQAFNRFGVSDYSNEASISAKLPAPPAGLTVNVTVQVNIN